MFWYVITILCYNNFKIAVIIKTDTVIPVRKEIFLW